MHVINFICVYMCVCVRYKASAAQNPLNKSAASVPIGIVVNLSPTSTDYGMPLLPDHPTQTLLSELLARKVRHWN